MSFGRNAVSWRVKSRKREQARELAAALDMHPVAAELLLQRGFKDLGSMRTFLYPDLTYLHDPFLLPGMMAAVERIRRALANKEKVCIYGDFDADGLTATAVLVSYFQHLEAQICAYIPERLDEGYGLHREAIARLSEQGVKLIITVDCGINAQEEVEYARGLGLDVIISDHHSPDATRLPQAVAVLNPKLNASYPFPELAGVGVALKIVQALSGIGAAAKYLDLAALGTVADVVPLIDENRIIVYYGLEALRTSRRPGLEALLREADLAANTKLRASQVAFMLAPRLNAAGRFNQAAEALQLLLTEDREQASRLAASLSALNSHRQAVEQNIFLEAQIMADALPAAERHCLVLAKENWHPGVIGIVASRLAEKYHRPAILLALEGDEARGSGRSIPAFDLIAALGKQDRLLLSYGGHRAAAGLTLDRASVAELKQSLNAYVAANFSEADLSPTVDLDVELDPSEITMDLLQSLEKLEPYGAGHAAPVFCSKRWQLHKAQAIGQEQQHLKLELGGGGLPWEVLAWRRSQELGEMEVGDWLDVAYTLHRNEWQGRERLVLYLNNWRPSQPEEDIAIYDARFIPGPRAYLQNMLNKSAAAVVLFWPTFCVKNWPELKSLAPESFYQQTGPLFLQPLQGRWQPVASSFLDGVADLIWLDAPQGMPDLRRYALSFSGGLRHRIHLLYNIRDVQEAYSLRLRNGPSRRALGTLYRGLRAASGEKTWPWPQLGALMQERGYAALPDQTYFHLRVLEELALAECACAARGVDVKWLSDPAEKRDLSQSALYSQAEAAVAAFQEAMDWLTGPDAAGEIARRLEAILQKELI